MAVLGGTSARAEAPPQISIEGQLAKPNGSPLTGERVCRVRFFDAAADGNQLGADITGTVVLSARGLFSLALTPDAAALDAATLYYELAIDTDDPADGDAADDVFPERVQVLSVPFALRAAQAANATSLDGTPAADYATDSELNKGLASKADAADTYTKTESDTLLAGKADAADTYTKTEADTLLAAKADAADTYTKTESDTLLAGKADIATTYTKTESDTLLAAKADGTHSHDLQDLGGAVTDAQVPDTITVEQAANALALGGTPAADYATNLYVDTGLASKASAIHNHYISQLLGEATDDQIPNTITVDQATNALELGGTPAADYATDAELAGKSDTTHSHDLQNLGGEATDAQVADDLTVSASGSVAGGSLHFSDGEQLDLSPINASSTGEGLRLPQASDVSSATAQGQMSWDSDDHRLYVGTGGALKQIDGLPRTGPQYVVVQLAEENTDVENTAALRAAYSEAKTLSPGAGNRVAVIVPPGRYDLGVLGLTLDTAYIDLIGLTTGRTAQYLYGIAGYNKGVLMQTVDNVRIENLTIKCTSLDTGLGSSADPAAYWPNYSWDSGALTGSGPNTFIKNCYFIQGSVDGPWSTRCAVAYAGEYVDCEGGNYLFGGGASSSTAYGEANGTFVNCTGGMNAFGGGRWARASGIFTNCTGGDYSFGGGLDGSATGTYTNCTGGDVSFGGWATANGTFINCTGGRYAFGGDEGEALGTFTRCKGGNYSFGGSAGKADGDFTDCTGGEYSFGGGVHGSVVGWATGTYTNCTGGTAAFGGGGGSGHEGKFYHCRGGAGSFPTIPGATPPIIVFCVKNGAAYP